MTTIQELATQLYDAFQTKTRDNGHEFVCLKDGSPEWMADVIRAAHDNADMLPDDWRYRFIMEASEAISGMSDSEDTDDAGAEFADQGSVYTADLINWLGSHARRISYCDEAIEDCGPVKNVVQAMSYGQYNERREVFAQVLEALQGLADDGGEA